MIIDRLYACKYWRSEIDCEMVELLIKRYRGDLDWSYLEKKSVLPEIEILPELLKLRERVSE